MSDLYDHDFDEANAAADRVIKTPLFPLGQVVATPGALLAFARAQEVPTPYLARHVTGDWGDLDDHDRAENQFSLTRHLRLMSAYTLADGTRIWIITEADRSSTTVLLPDEY